MRLFRTLFPVATISLLLSDAVLSAGSFVLALYIVRFDADMYLMYENGIAKVVFAVASFCFGVYFQDLYAQARVRSRVLLGVQICGSIGLAFLLQALSSYLRMDVRLPIKVMMLGSAFLAVSVFLWRISFNGMVLESGGGERLLFVGYSPLMAEIAHHIEEYPETGLVVIGRMEEPGGDVEDIPGVKSLGPISALLEVVRAANPDRIIVGMSERRNRLPLNDLLEIRMGGRVVEELGIAFERICKRVSLPELRPSQLIYSGDMGPRLQYRSVQYLWNLAFAIVGLTISAPFILLTAIAVKLSSNGPILYRQVRVGFENVPFTLYKFRSMRNDAEAGTGAVWASKDDPRITGVGRIIRKLRLDELPQLFNVLKGEMSIVGPRPERPEFVQMLSEGIPYFRQRCCVRPGITGWAQINYKYGDTLEDAAKKLEYDLFYIKNMSFWLDMYIAFHTLKAMLLSRGAQ